MNTYNWIPLILTVLLGGCASIPMDGAIIKSRRDVRTSFQQFAKGDPSLFVKEGEEVQIYGPWRSNFETGTYVRTGDRLWQLVFTGKDGKVKTVWLNAETGKLKVIAGGNLHD